MLVFFLIIKSITVIITFKLSKLKLEVAGVGMEVVIFISDAVTKIVLRYLDSRLPVGWFRIFFKLQFNI